MTIDRTQRSDLMKRLFHAAALIGVAACTPVVHASVILVEFGETLAGEGPGGTWNRFGTTAAINGSAVKDSGNVTTPVTLSWSGNLTVSTNAGTTNAYDNTSAVGNPSWVATTTNNLVAGDLFYTENGSSGVTGQVTFTFGGLTAGDKVSLDFLGARNTSVADGFYEYSLDGTNYFGLNVLNPDGTPTTVDGWSGQNTKTKSFDNLADGYTAHRYMNVSDIALTASTFQFRATDISNAGGNFAAMNALRLTVVPEPATVSLLALGAIGLLARRRRAISR